jgi:hypothetical protein
MKQAHFICRDIDGKRWYLGRHKETHRYGWLEDRHVKETPDNYQPLIYMKKIDALASAGKIGEGAYVLTIHY